MSQKQGFCLPFLRPPSLVTVPLIDDDDLLFCERFSGPGDRACGEERPCGSHEGVGGGGSPRHGPDQGFLSFDVAGTMDGDAARTAGVDGASLLLIHRVFLRLRLVLVLEEVHLWVTLVLMGFLRVMVVR